MKDLVCIGNFEQIQLNIYLEIFNSFFEHVIATGDEVVRVSQNNT